MTTKGKLEPPPQALLEPLLELRDYYTALTEEYERLWRTARSQLMHVEALLSNCSAVDERDNLMAVVETLSFAPTSGQQESLSLQQLDNISDIGQQEAIESELQDDEEQEIDLDDSEQQEAIESELQDDEEQEIDLDDSSSNDENTVVARFTISSQRETPTHNNDNSGFGTDIPMLAQYQVLTRMQAIEKILRENAGTVCHIDFIVRSLFGDLEPSVFKIVKSRIQSSLTHGKEKSYWAAVPDEPGCYTLDLSLVRPPNSKVKSKTIKPKRKKPFLLPKAKRVPMLPEYEGKFLIDAICILLQKNSGKIFSVADVITGLYGELNAEQLREIKTAVHNELSRGHRIGRFSRVPEKLGYYTWDLKKIRTK
ncbi:hypothetical protein [Brasilonema sp. UFV-L1]|uniref:hypothetical protein n=1 Tax=Brasilonema sp. UFV-L1 TaxID=2234130 RepID=UPI00145F24F9|nr:hypothetical protein [Brasilonema sp. UFV-L1]NMG10725.1 hypothetical protein [Brasilonema sp. UFV-L1]